MINPNLTFSESLTERLNSAIEIAATRSGLFDGSVDPLSDLAAAAMLELIDLNLFPSFAVDGPWMNRLYSRGLYMDPPDLLCLLADDAILLAPSMINDDKWMGFLIAQSSASGMVRSFSKIEANHPIEKIMLQLPKCVAKKHAFAGCISPAYLHIMK